MKNSLLILLFVLQFFPLCTSAQTNDYDFNGYPVPRKTIEAYLSRSAGMPGLLSLPFQYNNGSNTHNAAALASSPEIAHTLNLINTLSPKMIERADALWGDDAWVFLPGIGHWDNIEWMATQVHNIDDQIILDAGLMECVATNVSLTGTIRTLGALSNPAEAYIRTAFPNLPLGGINITPKSMLYPEIVWAIDNNLLTPTADTWLWPDISRLETQVWFYYRACEYIRRGFESIHMGRMDLMLKRDCDNLIIADLIQKINNFGSSPNGSGGTMARRGVVFFNDICGSVGEPEYLPGCIQANAPPLTGDPNAYDSDEHRRAFYHKEQVYYAGNPDDKKLLWDWGTATLNILEKVTPLYDWNINNQIPISNIHGIKDVEILEADNPDFGLKGHIQIPPYNRMEGGIHPQGWLCDHVPYFVGFDNATPFYSYAPFKRDQHNHVYGMDEKTWYTSIPDAAGHQFFLQYTQQTVRCLDKNAYFTMPVKWRSVLAWDDPNQVFAPLIPNTNRWDLDNYYSADHPNFNVVPTIVDLWNNPIHQTERNERFVNVNKRDGSVYPTFSWGEKIYTGDFNSDGKDDILAIANNDPGVNISWDGYRVYQANSNGDDFDEMGISGQPFQTPHPCNPPGQNYIYLS